MTPKPRVDLRPNTAEFEQLPFVKPTGFREYDARWRYPEEINLMGFNGIGLALATLAADRGAARRFVVGFVNLPGARKADEIARKGLPEAPPADVANVVP